MRDGRVVELPVNVDEDGVAFDLACVDRDGGAAGMPISSPVVRSKRDAWAAQTSVSSGWRKPS